MAPFHEDYVKLGRVCSHLSIEGTIYLAFRDLSAIIQTYIPRSTENKLTVLDFGCGTGLSTRFLKACQEDLPYALEVDGADISEAVLKLAQEADPAGRYLKIENNRIPTADASYDLVHNSFVLFEMESLDQMTQVLREINRVMRQEALLIATTGSVDQYVRTNQWVSLTGDFPENEHLKSGDLGRIDVFLNEGTISFHNYYWTQADYEQALQKAGFTIHQVWRPLGYVQEENVLPWKWKDEKRVSPYYVFIAQR